jgi:hypothetical protein
MLWAWGTAAGSAGARGRGEAEVGMDDEAPVARYDPAAGTLRLRLTGGEEVLIGGLGADLALWRTDGEASRAPLWLTAAQADVLGKMIDYILKQVRVSAASQEALAALQPQVADVRDQLDAAQALFSPTAPPDDDGYADE